MRKRIHHEKKLQPVPGLTFLQQGWAVGLDILSAWTRENGDSKQVHYECLVKTSSDESEAVVIVTIEEKGIDWGRVIWILSCLVILTVLGYPWGR